MRSARTKAVCLSERRADPKTNIACGELRANWGLVGDAHVGPRLPDRWQVSLLAWEKVERLNPDQGLSAVPGSFAENLSMDGPDTSHLRVGDRLRIGGLVLLEVEHLCKPSWIAHAYSFRGHSLLPSVGIFCAVLVGGTVPEGDEIEVLPKVGPTGL